MYTQKLFYLNSRDRTSGTDSDFTINLRDLQNFQPTHVVVLQANIPKSYYVVQEGQNTFTLTEEDSDTVEITIPPSNYTRINFKSVLQSLLTTHSPNAYVYTITIPNSTSSGDNGKYTFTCAGHTLESKIIMEDNNLFELMGFDSFSTNSFTTGTLVSTNIVKISKEDTIFIHSDMVGGLSDSILQDIYSVGNGDYSNIVFQNFAIDQYSKEMVGNTSNNFRFYLANEDGERLDLNGLNWTMTLCCFKKDNTNDLLTKFIKLSAGRL